MSIKNILIQYIKKSNCVECGREKANYFFYLSAYRYYLFDRLRSLNIWTISPDRDNFLYSIGGQIDSYAKENLLNYIIQHEFSILNSEGYLYGDSDFEKELDYIYNVSNSSEWVIYLFDKYPLLENLLYNFTENTLAYLSQILSDYIKEKESLKEKFNVKHLDLIDVKLFMGDFHNKGKFVTKFIFSGGFSLMYKPRLAKNEDIFNSLINTINNSGLDVQIKIPSYWEINGHTWVEFIWPYYVPEDFNPHFYYKNLGKILGILYAVGVSDINAENLICSGGLPTIIDLECISKVFVKNTSISLFENYFNRSVISIGILPVWKHSNLYERNLLLSILFKFGSNIHLPQNSKTIFELSSDTFPDFVSGFNDSYLALQHIDLDIFHIKFKNCKQRVVIHDTLLYACFQREMRLPESLHGGQSIVNLVKKSIPKSYSDYSKELCQSILEQLNNNDIPLFYISPEGNIIDAYGNKILSLNNVIKDERVLSSTDLIFQKRIIESSINQVLDSLNPIRHKVSHIIANSNVDKSILQANCKSAAQKVSNEIFKNCLKLVDEINWIGKNPSKIDGRFQVDIMDESLYSGTAGIAMLFGQIAKVENHSEYFRLYSAIQRNLKKRFYRITNGIVDAKIYGDAQAFSYHFYPICCIFLTCCNSNKDNIDKKYILDILSFVKENYLPYVKDCGYLGGIIGYIDCLIELQRNKIVELPYYYIEEVYEKLLGFEQLNNNVSIFPHFESMAGKSTAIPLGGFAHGSAGIAYVLYKLFKLTKDNKIYSKFIRVLNHDRFFFNQLTNSWTDGRIQGSHQDMGAWCHGAGGIGLSRVLLIREGYYDDIVIQELNNAVSVLKKHLGQNQCICHGDLGNLEILKMIADTIHDNELHLFVNSQINNLAIKVISGEKLVFGDGHTFPNLGLFLGQAGIAYQMLRFSNWEKTSSVLFSDYHF